jgi:cytokinin dehydrogenase
MHTNIKAPQEETISISDILDNSTETQTAFADDFGHLISKTPKAVIKVTSAEDIIRAIKFARKNKIKIAARGQGHSTFGQSQVEQGFVIDMSSLNQIHTIDNDRAVVDGGVLWIELLQKTLEKNLTPPVLTNYLGLSVGGTLSIGGMGGTVHQHGLQIDNVLELLVATGTGELKTCSLTKNRELFEAILGGLGQCGIIVKATIKLVTSHQNARIYSLVYDNFKDFIDDQRLLAAEKKFHCFKGIILSNPQGGWNYILEAASFWSPPNEPSHDALISALKYMQSRHQEAHSDDLIPGLKHIQSMNNVEDKSYFNFINEPVVEILNSMNVWSTPHPWFDVFLPSSVVEDYAEKVLSSLPPSEMNDGFIFLYPVDTQLCNMPLFRLPNEPIAFLFGILRNQIPQSATVAQILDSNRKFFEQSRDCGGYRYTIGSIPFAQTDWKQHFGDKWDTLVSFKKKYDPDNILTPGQGIF